MRIFTLISCLLIFICLQLAIPIHAQHRIDSLHIALQNPPPNFGLNNVKMYFKYNQKGQCIREDYYLIGGGHAAYILFAYHNNGKIESKEIRLPNGELSSKSIYNEEGFELSSSTFSGGALRYVLQKTYDDRNNLSSAYYEVWDDGDDKMVPNYRIDYEWDANNLLTSHQDQGWSRSSGWEPQSRAEYTNGMAHGAHRMFGQKFWLFNPIYEPQSGEDWELQYEREYDWDASLAFGCSGMPMMKQKGWHQEKIGNDFIFKYGKITRIRGPVSCDANTGKIIGEVEQRLSSSGEDVYYDVFQKKYGYNNEGDLISLEALERNSEASPWKRSKEGYAYDNQGNLTSFMIYKQEGETTVPASLREFIYEVGSDYSSVWRSITVDQILKDLFPEHIDVYKTGLKGVRFSSWQNSRYGSKRNGDWSTSGEIIVSSSEVITDREEVAYKGLQVYPNPFIDKVFINTPTNLSNGLVSFCLFNLAGELVYQTKLSDKGPIGLGHLTSGMYVYVWTDKEHTKTGKLLKTE